MLYGSEDKFAESEALYGKVVDGLQRVKGNEHPLTLQWALRAAAEAAGVSVIGSLKN